VLFSFFYKSVFKDAGLWGALEYRFRLKILVNVGKSLGGIKFLPFGGDTFVRGLK
jgi:hypothetical protein